MSTLQHPSAAGQSSLVPYSPSLTFSRLQVGVDNIRYDVCLSPHWREQASQYLFEQILHYAQPCLHGLYPSDPRSRGASAVGFRRQLGQLLEEALNQAKEHDNIEFDLLARLAVAKWLAAEMPRQFSQLAVACRERADKATRVSWQGSMDDFVLRSRIADFQASRRALLRAVADQLCQLFEEMEERTLRPSRAALLGSAFSELYAVVANRLVFLENPNDAVVHLEHYAMLGHFKADVDREDRVYAVFVQLLSEQGLAPDPGQDLAALEQTRGKAVDSLQDVTSRLREAELALAKLTQKEADRSGGLRWLENPLAAKGETNRAALEHTARSLAEERQRLVDEVEKREREVGFLRQSREARLGEILSNPANAERLFGALGPTGEAMPRSDAQEALLRQLSLRLERAGMLKPILAAYLVKALYKEFCPPLNPQQLKYAIVDRHGWDELEGLLAQFPTHKFPLEKLEEAAQRLRHLSRAESDTLLLRFAHDLMRVRRDLLHRQLLAAAWEKIHLVADEKTRHVSRLNATLYEFLLPEERELGEERVLTHVVLKADVRDSTRITEDLLRRGLNPATHFSFHFYEPVRKLMAQYSATKIFIEGDALILGLYETESNRAFQRPVSKACLLAKEIVQLCQSYNERARANDLPALELGLGIAYQDRAPHYWADGESRILISAALNQSDRLSSSTRLGQKLFAASSDLPFRVYCFQVHPLPAVAEEEEEFLLRYNVMGVALSPEAFQKLRQEISLTPRPLRQTLFGQEEVATLYCGTVPLGQRFEKLIVREARLARLHLPDRRVVDWTPQHYYEVCVSPALYEQVYPQRGLVVPTGL